jgi:hypothetical protein
MKHLYTLMFAIGSQWGGEYYQYDYSNWDIYLEVSRYWV